MFVAVIMGYVVTAIFAFCGIAATVIFLSDMSQISDKMEFITGICMAAWPLAVAAVVYLLTQISLLIERQGIISANFSTTTATPTAKTAAAAPGKLQPPAPLPAGRYFHVSAPSPMPQMTPTLPQKSTSVEKTEISIEEAANIATAAAAAAAQEAAEPAEKIEPVIKRREGDLSFFRVD